MAWWDWLGNAVKNTSQWIGEKAKDAGHWIAEKAKPMLPVIKGVSDAVGTVAGLVDGVVPMAGLIKRGANWVSNQIGN